MNQPLHILDLSQWTSAELLMLDVIAAGLKAAARNCRSSTMQVSAWAVADRLHTALAAAIHSAPPLPGGSKDAKAT